LVVSGLGMGVCVLRSEEECEVMGWGWDGDKVEERGNENG
jgi:hypothetical protein